MTSLEIVLLVIIGLLLLGGFWLLIFLLEFKDDKNYYMNMFNETCDRKVKLHKIVEDFKTNHEDSFQEYLLPIRKTEDISAHSTQEIEQELEERKLKQEYPLAYSIKHNAGDYIEIYINGKFKDKYTREYAWTWAKSYATKYDYKQNGNVYELNDKKEVENV